MVSVQSKVLLVEMLRMLRGRVRFWFLNRVLSLLFVLLDWGSPLVQFVQGIWVLPQCFQNLILQILMQLGRILVQSVLLDHWVIWVRVMSLGLGQRSRSIFP